MPSDIYAGESGARIEVRYLDEQRASNGLRVVDEIVTERVHLEMLDGGSAYLTLDGLRVTLCLVRRRRGGTVLEVTAEPDGCTRATEAIRAGETVEYAQGRYVVAERHGDLLTLAGVVGNVVIDSDGDGSGTCRARTVVLASDVRRVAEGQP